ncbi:U3 small nucleolar RNA-associated protein 14 A [Chionoecetes opilio]|uniref:U3 small nucleolar RNA-associated protein 14 A n=1 Tax=Chionoecetes opilio TaxID=41210 RepID=A0A8J4YC14_CHIOP|nr:U3 small nucleolar RNA-associated protein 14 A [Chionoecetes opilio]
MMVCDYEYGQMSEAKLFFREKEEEEEQMFMVSGVSHSGMEEDNEGQKEEGEDQQHASHAHLLSDIMKMSKKGKVEVDVRTSLAASSLNTSHLLTRILPSTSLRKNKHTYTLAVPVEKTVSRREVEEEAGARKAVSLQQVRERNRELWRQKEMKRRYEQKARLMNKSKSRKHHRLLRRERLKKQKAELEELHKTDPEAALDGLQQLERARIEERMSLRHKTSKWAHLQGLRATTDKSVMAALRENQRMYKELTGKATQPVESEEEEDVAEGGVHSQKGEERVQCEAPAMSPATLGSNICLRPRPQRIHTRRSPSRASRNSGKKSTGGSRQTGRLKNRLEAEREETRDGDAEMMDEEEGKTQEEEEEEEEKLESEKLESEKPVPEGHGLKTLTKQPKKKKNKKSMNSLDRTDQDQEALSIDDLFDKVEIGIKNKVKKKLKRLGVHSQDPWTEVKKKGKKKKAALTIAPSEIEEFDFTSTRNQENIDETKERAGTVQALESLEEEGGMDKLQAAVQTLKGSPASQGTLATHKAKTQVDPNKFLQVEPKQLMTALPDCVGEAGEAMEDTHTETAEDIIREAFSDDYLMEEFSVEKGEAVRKDQAGGLSAAMPGWGDWTGPNIQMSNTKRKRFGLRLPHAPRKDSRLGHVLYNEKADVSELPYPFKGVKDFEASVRAPVGRLFVPEAVHKRLTAPPVVIKMSTVIQPMTEEELLRHERSGRGEAEVEDSPREASGGTERPREASGGTQRKVGQRNSKRKVSQLGERDVVARPVIRTPTPGEAPEV